MFKKHLQDHGVSYFQHQKLAFFFGIQSLKAGVCGLIHGIIPGLFKTTASDIHKSILPEYQKRLERFQGDYKTNCKMYK